MAGARQIAVFQVLADPTRLAIFEHLSQGETTVGSLVEKFPISQPAVSQHLAVLRQSGLVEHRREGRNIFYQARPDGLAPLTDWLNHYRVFWPERLARLRKLLAEQNAGKGEKNERK
jgi:DNA-binding transcriptional ArsR family regulator